MDLLVSDEEEKREKCRYGAKCYRKNPQHKRDFRHVNDSDWTDEEAEDEDEKLQDAPEEEQEDESVEKQPQAQGKAKRKAPKGKQEEKAKKPKGGQSLLSFFGQPKLTGEEKKEEEEEGCADGSEEGCAGGSEEGKGGKGQKAFPSTVLSLKAGELMHTTSGDSARKRKWLAFTNKKTREVGRCYCSTDGSSTGWHACCVVPANSDKAFIRGIWGDMKGSRNVGAEAAGFLLGVLTLPSDSNDVVFLADFLNALAWDVGGANYKHEVLVSVYSRVEAEKARRKKKGPKGAVKLRWDHIHHPGHQKDSCW
jgi:hypothetical protein